MDAVPASLTVRQAYEAMLVFLKRECDLTESEDLADLLAQYAFTSDGGTRDPDVWESWLRATAQVTGAGKDGGSQP
ncbi:MAG: hypothetical protein ACJ8LG_09045 [Massilia sp.]